MENFIVSCQDVKLLLTSGTAHWFNHKGPRTSLIHQCHAFLPIKTSFVGSTSFKLSGERLVSMSHPFLHSPNTQIHVANLLVPVAMYLHLRFAYGATVPLSTLILAIACKMVQSRAFMTRNVMIVRCMWGMFGTGLNRIYSRCNWLFPVWHIGPFPGQNLPQGHVVYPWWCREVLPPWIGSPTTKAHVIHFSGSASITNRVNLQSSAKNTSTGLLGNRCHFMKLSNATKESVMKAFIRVHLT